MALRPAHTLDSDSPDLFDDGLGTIVTDQTITFTGRAFYSGFSRAWQPPDNDFAGTLAVRERPSARWGSLIWVEYRNEIVFRTFLFPGRVDPEAVGASAAEKVAEVLEQKRIERLMFKEPDLAPSELWGDGQ